MQDGSCPVSHRGKTGKMLHGFLFRRMEVSREDMYVNSGGVGRASLLVLIVLLGIAALIIWKKVGKTIDFEEIRRTW